MVSVCGLNLAQALVNAELRIAVLEKVVEHLINSQAHPGQRPNIDEETVRRIRSEALNQLKQKYPELGITMDED